MPALKQINSDPTANPHKKRIKFNRSLILRIIVLLLLIAGGYLYHIRPRINVIPDKIYATQPQSIFKDLFADNMKKIIWFGADCPDSYQQKVNINRSLQYMRLDEYYKQRPFLQNSLSINCINCLDYYMMEMCADGYCIIVPASHRIIKTNRDKLFKDLEKYKGL